MTEHRLGFLWSQNTIRYLRAAGSAREVGPTQNPTGLIRFSVTLLKIKWQPWSSPNRHQSRPFLQKPAQRSTGVVLFFSIYRLCVAIFRRGFKLTNVIIKSRNNHRTSMSIVIVSSCRTHLGPYACDSVSVVPACQRESSNCWGVLILQWLQRGQWACCFV